MRPHDSVETSPALEPRASRKLGREGTPVAHGAVSGCLRWGLELLAGDGGSSGGASGAAAFLGLWRP